jgi:2-polyprenyl-3-methyl-5-hydroxy-6-metoxy-1,4-benzoquinol methylase
MDRNEAAPIVEEMQAYYERRAPFYDESMGYTDPAVVARLEPVMDSLRAQLANRSVVEIACGPAFWTHAVSESAAMMTATDYNRSTLAEARRKTLDWRHVSLVAADAYALPFAGGLFDGALAVDWLAHVPKSRLSLFLDGLHATLRPGARVVFCDQLAWRDSQTGIYDAEGNHLQERALPDGSRYHVIKHFRSDDEWRALFSPYAERVDIESFPDCRRAVAGYTLRVTPPAA